MSIVSSRTRTVGWTSDSGNSYIIVFIALIIFVQSEVDTGRIALIYIDDTRAVVIKYGCKTGTTWIGALIRRVAVVGAGRISFVSVAGSVSAKSSAVYTKTLRIAG